MAFSLVIYFINVCWNKTIDLAGDNEFSFAYESTGRAVSGGEFKEYGKTFTEKDVIGAYVVSDENIIIFKSKKYSKGNWINSILIIIITLRDIIEKIPYKMYGKTIFLCKDILRTVIVIVI